MLLKNLIDQTKNLLNGTVIPFLMVVATVVFIYALVMYIGKSGDEKVQIQMKATMRWSIISLAVIVSVWSLAGLLSSYVGTAPIPERVW